MIRVYILLMITIQLLCFGRPSIAQMIDSVKIEYLSFSFLSNEPINRSVFERLPIKELYIRDYDSLQLFFLEIVQTISKEKTVIPFVEDIRAKFTVYSKLCDQVFYFNRQKFVEIKEEVYNAKHLLFWIGLLSK